MKNTDFILRVLRSYGFTILLSYGLLSCVGRSHRQQEQPVADETLVQDLPDGWEPLMDGKTLKGWEILRYGGEGEPYVKNGILTLPMAVSGTSTGVQWIGDPLPVNNYVIYYEARRVEGNDIFGGLTFPYGDTFATLIIGGWGGIVSGLSSIDGYDASENETTKHVYFRDNQWYPVHLRVTPDSIRAVVDTVQVVNLATAGKTIHLRSGTYATNFTLTSYRSTGEIRNLRIKRLE